MRKKIIILLLLLQSPGFKAFALNPDSLLFITEVKKFAFTAIGAKLTGDLFTKWTTEEKPFLYLYISHADSVKKPTECNSSFIYCGTDETKANVEESTYIEKGYHTFCYQTRANSAALINRRLLSYPHQAIAFIVFHELVHNYIHQFSIKIPYEFNEALCDVIGNYGALAYASSTGGISIDSVQQQITTNEKIYEMLNETIANVNANPEAAMLLHANCNKRLKGLAQDMNIFQRDRFDYVVNNAYLLKNEYYCKHYFLLKKVFLKQASIQTFLELMKTLPEKTVDCEVYLKGM